MEGYTEPEPEQEQNQEKERCMNDCFKLALTCNMLRHKSNDAGMMVYSILVNELNTMEGVVKDTDACKANVMDYMQQHTKWQIRYADLVGNIVISNADLVKTRAKIHIVSCALYEHMPDQMAHPKYKKYIGYKNGDVYSEYAKKMLVVTPQGGYIVNKITIDNDRNYIGIVRQRLILECFLQTQLNAKFDVDHINGDKLNNCVTNLQFLTRCEHVKKTLCGKPSNSRLVLSKPIIRFKLDDNDNRFDEKIYISATEAAKDPEINCTKSSIGEVLNIKGRTCKGYFWEYVLKDNNSEYKDEIWKKLNEVDKKFGETKAEVSNFGRIKSGHSVISFGSKSTDGYLAVKIGGGSYKVHYLVILAFLGPMPSDKCKYSVDHIDKNRGNNKLENLRWATDREQANNSWSKPVDMFKNGKFVERYESQTIAGEKLGISNSTIGKACYSQDKIRKCYTFKFADLDTN
jgi:hypothetical protein